MLILRRKGSFDFLNFALLDKNNLLVVVMILKEILGALLMDCANKEYS